MDALLRLAWALPLVLGIGIGSMLVLRRFVIAAPAAARPTQRLRMRESLSLSDETRVHLIEVDDRPYLVVESVRQAVLQPTAPLAVESARAPNRIGLSWMQRMYKAASR
jgi:flagellar biogenesis protein FliO